MDTMTIERETETIETTDVAVVPTLKPSDVFKLAMDNGWKLTTGIYGMSSGSMGCAVGAIRRGMVLAELGGQNQYGGDQIYNVITTTFPALAERHPVCEIRAHVCGCGCQQHATVLAALEHGFESHSWDAEDCMAFLTERGL
jgi:hypothetical protein